MKSKQSELFEKCVHTYFIYRYDSFGSAVPSCGQRTVRFEQACVLFNVAAVYTQMGTKRDRRLFRHNGVSYGGGKDDREDDADAARCFLRAAGAYRHIGDTFANAPDRAADLRAVGHLYALMMVSILRSFVKSVHACLRLRPMN